MISLGNLLEAVEAEKNGKNVVLITKVWHHGYMQDFSRTSESNGSILDLPLENFLDKDETDEEGIGDTYTRSLLIKE